MNPAAFLRRGDPATLTQQFARHKYGRDLELVFLHAWRTVPVPPPWYRGVRDVSERTDVREHVDAYIDTPWGEIPIQIKASTANKIAFEDKYPGIPVVVLWIHDKPSCVRGKTYQAVRDHPVMAPYEEVLRREKERRAAEYRLRLAQSREARAHAKREADIEKQFERQRQAEARARLRYFGS